MMREGNKERNFRYFESLSSCVQPCAQIKCLLSTQLLNFLLFTREEFTRKPNRYIVHILKAGECRVGHRIWIHHTHVCVTVLSHTYAHLITTVVVLLLDYMYDSSENKANANLHACGQRGSRSRDLDDLRHAIWWVRCTYRCDLTMELLWTLLKTSETFSVSIFKTRTDNLNRHICVFRHAFRQAGWHCGLCYSQVHLGWHQLIRFDFGKQLLRKQQRYICSNWLSLPLSLFLPHKYIIQCYCSLIPQ